MDWKVEDCFLSLSLDDSFGPDFAFDSDLLFGELVTFFNVDMLGFPDPLAEGCLGEAP